MNQSQIEQFVGSPSIVIQQPEPLIQLQAIEFQADILKTQPVRKSLNDEDENKITLMMPEQKKNKKRRGTVTISPLSIPIIALKTSHYIKGLDIALIEEESSSNESKHHDKVSSHSSQ